MALFSLKFITGVKWYKGLLEALNNMTFIYDPNWDQNNNVKMTLPVCFFHVKNCHEIMSSEISQKQMLFYNSSLNKNSSDPAVDSGLLNVVADNIVIKPKTYKLDVVIPYKNITLLDQSFVYNTHTMLAITSTLLGKDSTKNKNLGALSTLSQPFLTLLKTVISSLLSGNYLTDAGKMELSEIVGNIAQQPDYNKDSLETMWRMRHILKMKMWNSWRYKYVAINDFDITKDGTEDGVYEATLTVQEMPIVSMYAQGKNVLPVFERKNKLLKARGEIAIKTLDKASGLLGKGN